MRYRNAVCLAIHSTVLQRNPNSIQHIAQEGVEEREGQLSLRNWTLIYISYSTFCKNLIYSELSRNVTIVWIESNFTKNNFPFQRINSYLAMPLIIIKWSIINMISLCQSVSNHSDYKYKLWYSDNMSISNPSLHHLCSVTGSSHKLKMF